MSKITKTIKEIGFQDFRSAGSSNMAVLAHHGAQTLGERRCACYLPVYALNLTTSDANKGVPLLEANFSKEARELAEAIEQDFERAEKTLMAPDLDETCEPAHTPCRNAPRPR